MDMDFKTTTPKQQSAYPDPTRGPLRPTSDLPPPRRKRAWGRARDYQPFTLIMMFAGICFVVGAIGAGAFYLTHRRAEANAQNISLKVAAALANRHAAADLSTMQSQVYEQFKNCSETPTARVIHTYQDPGQPVRTEFTPIDFGEDLAVTLDHIIEKSDTAMSNELQVACPSDD